MVREPLLVVVTGPPASGKSSIARDLASELSIAFLSKDDFKERLYEQFSNSEALEDAIERSALEILYSVVETNLKVGVDVLVESNFDVHSDTARLRAMPARLVQVHCGGDADELAATFVSRLMSGNRHPGHNDAPEDAAEIRAKIEAGCWDPLDLPGETLRVDTTSGDPDIERLAAAVGGHRR